MWKRVERLMRGTIQNKVDRETHFINKFDQFVAESGEALVSVYIAQLMNDLERNDMRFLIVTINTKFLNSLQPEWLKYVTQVRLAKCLTVDRVDDLFDYLLKFKKLINTFRAKKLEKTYDPLALVAHTGSSSKNTSYYMTHPTSVVNYDNEYKQDDIQTNSEDPLTSAIIQPTNHYSNVGPSYDSAFVGEVQSLSINENEEQMYPTHTKIINSTIGDDQIDSNIIFNTPNRNVNSGSVEKDTHVPNLLALEQLARNAYQEVKKKQIFAQKVQTQNKTLNSQLELYKERVWVLENINENNNYLYEFLEADQRAKHFDQQAQS
nr:hypothetical protein [Tanacetum cinerariifolium]